MATGSETKTEINPSFGMSLTLKGIGVKFSDVHHISTSTLASWLDTEPENIILLDTRPEEEYTVSHLPKAVQVEHTISDVDTFVYNLPHLDQSADGNKKTKIVCYCSIGYRSSLMAQKLQKHFQTTGSEMKPEVYNLEGSIFKWANEQRRLVDNCSKTTIFAHPYNALWGKLLNKELRKSTL